MSKLLLVVDDSPTMRALASRTLRGAGFSVKEAEHGQAGLELLGQDKFDAVVTDLNMPVMDGLEMTANVRKNPETAGLPVIMVTTESSAKMRALGREAGATGWLVKPYDPQALVRTVRRVCP